MTPVLEVLRDRFGHDLSAYKRAFLERRILRRLASLRLENVGDYARLIEASPGERRLLLGELVIRCTSFFRDPRAFDALVRVALPSLLEDADQDGPLRVWVAGCSTGEEAYSVAMLLRELMEAQKQHRQIEIFATDLDMDAIEIARAGFYPARIASRVGARRLASFFTREGEGYRINDDLREMLIFSLHDVIEDQPFTRIDLLSCRNLLIYLEAEVQHRLLSRFHRAIRPAGALFLGASETIGSLGHLFETWDNRWRIFQRRVEPSDTPSFPRSSRRRLVGTRSRARELRPVIEQLRSANEELESANEELRARGERLEIITAELERSVQRLTRADDDLRNLLRSTETAAIFLDRDLAIRRYTEHVGRAVELTPEQVGRPFIEVAGPLAEEMLAQAKEVLRTLVTKEVHVRGRNGDSFLMRIAPYRTSENIIDGLVMTFAGLPSPEEARQIVAVLKSSPSSVFGQSRELRYLWMHGSMFGLTREQVLEKNDAELLPGPSGEVVLALKREAMIGGRPIGRRLALDAGGITKVYDFYLQPVRDGRGSELGLTGVVTELQ